MRGDAMTPARAPFILAMIVAMTVGCSGSSSTEGPPAITGVPEDGLGRPNRVDQGPYDDEAEARPDLLTIEPNPMSPGDEVELYFPQETERGVAYVLEKRVPNDWQVRYFLTSRTADYAASGPSWSAVDADATPDPWPDIAIDGPGPDSVHVPDTAGPGQYRICTANAPENFCAELEILAK